MEGLLELNWRLASFSINLLVGSRNPKASTNDYYTLLHDVK